VGWPVKERDTERRIEKVTKRGVTSYIEETALYGIRTMLSNCLQGVNSRKLGSKKARWVVLMSKYSFDSLLNQFEDIVDGQRDNLASSRLSD
jgi:hypothetical protein